MKRKTFTTIALAAALILSAAGAQTTQAQTAQSQSLSKPLGIAISSNLLSDAIGAPQLGITLQGMERWSITLGGHYGDWGFSQSKNHLRLKYGASVNIRRYFSSCFSSTDYKECRTFRGPYIGIGAGWQSIDLQYHNSLGREGTIVNAGLLGGYTWSLDFLGSSRWSLDTNLGIGLVHTDFNRYRWYAPAKQNRLVDTPKRNRLGITQGEISLVYQLK